MDRMTFFDADKAKTELETAFETFDFSYLLLNWLNARNLFDLELNPWDHEEFFNIPAFLREGWNG